MSKLVLASLAILSLAALAAPSFATHSVCDEPPYVDLEAVYLDLHPGRVHLYAESGVARGLQRGGSPLAFALLGAQDHATALGLTSDCYRWQWSDHLIL